jgi:hypothetical protein
MQYTPFYQYFPDLASKETRSIRVFFDNEWGLPADEYGLMELFCETRDCDCRRTMLMVVSEKSQQPVAVINFGWESRHFYEKWYGSNDKSVIADLKGPCLNIMAPKSKYADNILALICSTALTDADYVERIKRHYKLFKSEVKFRGK